MDSAIVDGPRVESQQPCEAQRHVYEVTIVPRDDDRTVLGHMFTSFERAVRAITEAGHDIPDDANWEYKTCKFITYYPRIQYFVYYRPDGAIFNIQEFPVH